MTRPINILELKDAQKKFEKDIRKNEREKVLDEVICKLTDEIDDRTRTFKGLHLAIKIVRELRKGEQE